MERWKGESSGVVLSAWELFLSKKCDNEAKSGKRVMVYLTINETDRIVIVSFREK